MVDTLMQASQVRFVILKVSSDIWLFDNNRSAVHAHGTGIRNRAFLRRGKLDDVFALLQVLPNVHRRNNDRRCAGERRLGSDHPSHGNARLGPKGARRIPGCRLCHFDHLDILLVCILVDRGIVHRFVRGRSRKNRQAALNVVDAENDDQNTDHRVEDACGRSLHDRRKPTDAEQRGSRTKCERAHDDRSGSEVAGADRIQLHRLGESAWEEECQSTSEHGGLMAVFLLVFLDPEKSRDRRREGERGCGNARREIRELETKNDHDRADGEREEREDSARNLQYASKKPKQTAERRVTEHATRVKEKVRTKFLPRRGLRVQFRMPGGDAEDQPADERHAGGDSGDEAEKHCEPHVDVLFIQREVQDAGAAQGVVENGEEGGAEDHVPPIRAVLRDPGELARLADHISGLLHGAFDFVLARDVRAVLDGRAAFAEVHFYLGHALDAADRVLEEQLARAAVHAANGNDFLMHKSKRQKLRFDPNSVVCYSRLKMIPVRENGWWRERGRGGTHPDFTLSNC